MSKRGRVLRGLVVAGVTALALVIGAVGWFWHLMQSDPMPDVARAANSPAARAADGLVTSQVDGQLTALRTALPWATYLGTATADLCSTQPAQVDEFVPAPQRWTAVSCGRTATLYEAFDGDFASRLAQLDAALDAAHWQARDTGNPVRPGQSAGLVAEFAHAHRLPDHPTPSGIAAADAPPNSLSVTYTSAPTGYRVVRVNQAPVPLRPDVGSAYRDHDSHAKGVYYLAWQPPPSAALATVYSTHSAVLAITVSAGYTP